MHFTTAVYCVY